MESKQQMVAVIEDDESYRVAVQRLLKSEGFSVQSFDSAEAFLNSGQQHETGCLIADIKMPGMSGLELQAKLNSDHCPIPTIFMTAHGGEAKANADRAATRDRPGQARNAPADGSLGKRHPNFTPEVRRTAPSFVTHDGDVARAATREVLAAMRLVLAATPHVERSRFAPA